MSFAREAILKAAAHIEQYPESYDFMRVHTPAAGERACLIGWIGHFMGMPQWTHIDKVAHTMGLRDRDTFIGPCNAFYRFMDLLDSRPDPNPPVEGQSWRLWHSRAAVAAPMLRKFAETVE
jgi:hypothetical protein